MTSTAQSGGPAVRHEGMAPGIASAAVLVPLLAMFMAVMDSYIVIVAGPSHPG